MLILIISFFVLLFLAFVFWLASCSFFGIDPSKDSFLKWLIFGIIGLIFFN